MAEVLVRYIDSGHVKTQSRYTAGMVVTVQDDGWPWGSLELATDAELGGAPREFFVVKMPGVSVQTIQDFLALELEDDPDEPLILPGGGKAKRLRKRRTHRVKPNLPGPLRQEIADAGFITLTEAEVRALLEAVA